MNELQKKYQKTVIPELKKEFGYVNPMAVPKIKKVSINVGLSKADKNPNFIKDVTRDIKAISGQAPVLTKARQAISGFKIRQGQDVGMVVTLRGRKMWDFLYRLVSAAIPRVRDFQGIEVKSFDDRGNLNLGIKEQLIFPEISSDNVDIIFGLQVNIQTTASTREEGVKFLRLLGFPIK